MTARQRREESEWYPQRPAAARKRALAGVLAIAFLGCRTVNAAPDERHADLELTPIAASNQAIDRTMWSGRVAWRVPYTRGMMYFTDLEAKLRTGRAHTSALDLVNAMGARFRGGAPMTNATREALLQDRVGPWAVAEWHAMLAGRLITPPSNAFGPCLARHARVAGLFDLGFATPTSVHAGETISGVNPAGNAWRAGLRDADVIAADVDINPAASGNAEPLDLPIRRSGENPSIRYDPHRGRAEDYARTRNRSQPDSRCGPPRAAG